MLESLNGLVLNTGNFNLWNLIVRAAFEGDSIEDFLTCAEAPAHLLPLDKETWRRKNRKAFSFLLRTLHQTDEPIVRNTKNCYELYTVIYQKYHYVPTTFIRPL